jgi:leucyl-tRNA synthetase
MASNELPAYEPQAIEPKWQRIWEERRQNEVREDKSKQKFYLLEMLPYASGDLHVGHARNYTLGDVVGRFRRMRGLNVLHPMGFDAFGLPAENAAIQRGIHPADWTETNIANMTRQLHRLGVAYDWTRVVDTSSPEYYRWTQWLFLLMYRRGLAYKKEAPVNWCPTDQTILANEQAEGGRCWRCGSIVEQRMVNQWFFKITSYADRLLEGLERLPHWPERIKTMQRNWIGRSEGVTFSFDVAGTSEKISTFTTRLDTIYGATFVAIAFDHPLVEQIVAGGKEEAKVRAFIDSQKNKSELERTQLLEKLGVFSGAHAKHPLTGERVPIWIVNYLVTSYGTGAVMGVPAHDERDLEFARKHRIDVKTVVAPAGQKEFVVHDVAYVEDGVLVNSGEFSGLSSAEARRAIAELLIERGIGEETVNFKLRDWLISRQRYWGAPIPFVTCPEHGLVPLPEDQLPVLLPYDAPFTGEQGSPLDHVPSFVNTTCPLCGGPAKRETDTMDTFMDSSWYFLRYTSPHDEHAPWSKTAADYWAPIDQYIGGAEHAVLHLLYARFFYKVLNEEGLVPGDEPFTRLFNQGSVLGADHYRMSKSRGNVVGIDDAADRYGVDALRIFEMFAGPPESDFPWSTTGIAGATRLLKRIWRLVLGHCDALRNPSEARADGSADTPLRFAVHSTIKKISEEMGERLHVNTSVSAIMTLLNDLEAYASSHEHASKSAAFVEGLRALILLVAPFAPHMTEELWERCGHLGSVHEQPWPVYNEAALSRALIPFVIQVNGKHRGTIEAAPGSTEDAVFEQAQSVPTVCSQLAGKTVRKKIFVPDKLLNIVAG